jgi:hypothetical protein
MYRTNLFRLFLPAAILLFGCQLLAPQSTLTLPAPEASPGRTPGPAATQAPASPVASTQTIIASLTPADTLPASPTSTKPSQAPSATSRSTKPPAATATGSGPSTSSAETWNDVPIMPGAVDGAEEGGVYSYTADASIAEVQAYYERVMPLAGWQSFASGEGETGNLMLMYQKDNTSTMISVIDWDGSTLVLIVVE